ncbi:hypothetical protein DPMN_058381 [Dreissena polymorpha]|uniref:Uncharacterized protein n=1 Tax=Dreissena polymorpha TaxID=45954 RepID=A0A9D4HFF6_DREPO|nr:hypothetical protein DPMN_058381 [Dreissena polymorpha]
MAASSSQTDDSRHWMAASSSQTDDSRHWMAAPSVHRQMIADIGWQPLQFTDR